MKTLRLFIIGAFLLGLFSISAMAQAVGTEKIGVINTFAFAGDKAGKGGITRYINAQKRLNAEFKVESQQINNLGTQITNLKKAIQTLNNSASKNVPVNRKVIADKAQKHDELVRQYKFKEDNFKVKYNKRLSEVMGPVNNNIGSAIQTFARQRGYALILDAARLEQANMILAYVDGAKLDVTKAFIAYYNARPTGAASTTP